MQEQTFHSQLFNSGRAPIWLNNFVDIYQKLSTNNLDLLKNVYHEDVTFIDPIHQIQGFNNVFQYFQDLYRNVSTCNFTITNVIVEHEQAAIYWEMTYLHHKLNQGKLITVHGSTHIKGQDDKVIYHRDFLDLGAMIYEQMPFLGKLIKWIKIKVAS